jgi:Kdo2-lipid IVA lauroyltransferase/acyltransferase
MKYIFNKIGIFVLLRISVLPLTFLFLFVPIIKFLIYKVFKYRVLLVKYNLKIAFPEKSETERLKIEKDYYQYLSELILEAVKGFTISAKELNKRIKTDDSYIYDSIFKNKESAIVAMGHNGNWEWICRHAPLYINTQICVAYKPLSNPQFDQLMNKVRCEFGIKVIPMAGIGRYIIENKNNPFLLILTADQSPSNPITGIWADFFHTPTSFLSGLEKLSLKYQLPVIFHEVKRAHKKGYYQCKVHRLLEPKDFTMEGSITQAYATFLENKIKEQPHSWLWSHKRWKHLKP